MLEAKTVLKLDRLTYDIAYRTVSDDEKRGLRGETQKLVDKWQSRLETHIKADRKRLMAEEAKAVSKAK